MDSQSAARESTTAIKPMTSAVNWALLGLLLDRSDYGYRLRQRYEQAYGDVLPLSSESRVYTALNELQRRGLIEEVRGDSASLYATDRQPKVRYSANTEGAHAFGEWMLTRVCADRREAQLFVRQLAVLAHEPNVALNILARYEETCLDEISDRPPTSPAPNSLTSLGLADRLMLEERRIAMENRLLWVEYARDEFRALADRGCTNDLA